MIVFLEGPDGSGKTYLYNQLVEERGIPIPKHTKIDISEAEALGQLTPYIYSELLHISDRSPLTDVIYRVFDSKKEVIKLDTLLNYLKVWKDQIVFVYCSNAKSKAYAIAHDENIRITQNHSYDILSNTYRNFMVFMEALGIKVITYDYTNTSFNVLVNKIVEATHGR